ncbi:MAG: family 1 glycosylhydrolase [Chitinophagaceae bacterium]
MLTETKYPSCTPELWGGIECTVNRLGNTYRDQLADADHYDRPGDIQHFGKLNITKLRYPVLWENHIEDADGRIDWAPTQRKLEEIRSENMVPIVGLVHHGSGPEHSNLLDIAFAEKLALYAGRVAAQFPWVEFYTPVNEPLTTARFSGLYGFWYPHHCKEKSFVQMLLNQVKGIILSMRAIRAVNPSAKLVQTEDLCMIHSTPVLAYQAAFENERRWLSFDLLCGYFGPEHSFWKRALQLGIAEEDLYFFTENNCPPDIIGCNYYVTSERYLDENIAAYPAHQHGGNGHHRYADIDAVRVHKNIGIEKLLREAWLRYKLPVAITECHLSCTREEQLRWFKETWDAACCLQQEGIPVRAVTAWSLLGSYDWNSLLTQQNGHYETGVFDISAGNLRPTLLAEMIQALAAGHSFNHPLLASKGWWRSKEEGSNPAAIGEPLIIISRKSTGAKVFELACRQRKIPYGLHSSAEILNADKAPWGVLFIVEQWDAITQNIAEDLSRYCRRRQVALMIVAPQFTDLPEHNFLLVACADSADHASVQYAMDIFIDGEHGQWRIHKQGARKISTSTPAFF